MQAVILAAGMGRRLGKYTKEVPKGLVEVGGKALLEHALDELAGRIDRAVLVIGYHGEKVKEKIGDNYGGIPIEYIVNEDYETTNNIYSLWLASEKMTEDDTILLESDVIFEKGIIDKLMEEEGEAVAVVHKFEDWMDGTVVLLDDEGCITSFISGDSISWSDKNSYYKTVNIYRFSKGFFKKHYLPFLRAYIESQGYSHYYENVLAVIVGIKKIKIKALVVDGMKWYEIDTPEDLHNARVLFSKPPEKLSLLKEMYGGYWRFPHILDFCYLVTPHFPPTGLIDEMKSSFEELLRGYPSGRSMVKTLLSMNFGVDEKHITAANGASEIIRVLPEILEGRFGIILPTFEEYPNRISKERQVRKIADGDGFRYDISLVEELFNEVENVVLVNPDNPSGNFIEVGEILKLLERLPEGKRLILDESFVDFAEDGRSLIDEEVLEDHGNLLVIKSISKSYGVPGLRLGVAATSDEGLLKSIEKRLPIWNINSFAEKFLQILRKYRKDYERACEILREDRKVFIERLSKIEGLRVFPSQANFVLCELGDMSSTELALRLAEKDIFIKDCSGKLGMGNKYVRFSIRTRDENERLIEALEEVIGRI